jgi:PPM family protein phosphatase
MNLYLSVNAICDVGCKKPNNEDMVLLHNELLRDESKQMEFDTSKNLIIAVADGIGGLDKGEVASEQVLTRLHDVLTKIPKDLSNEELREVFDVYAAETHNSMSGGMGSTLAGLFVYQGKVYRYHAGDSRIYRMRRGELIRLTKDHSLREAGGQPDAPSNVITNALGGGGSVFIEFAEIEKPFFDNDLYLLSSDGMHDLLTPDEILQALKSGNPAKKLVKMAKERGGKDNISVIIIKVKEK